jgi:uncharacterized protein
MLGQFFYGLMMAKILLFAVLALVIYLALRARSLGASRRYGKSATPNEQAEAIVACCRCGVHVPASESLLKDGRHYCSDEHRRLG